MPEHEVQATPATGSLADYGAASLGAEAYRLVPGALQ
jgi:hypothetical protein